MPRYPLIMKNKTYITLLQYAARKGISMGRLLNDLCDREAMRVNSDGQQPVSPVCIVCGKTATIRALGKGQQRFYVCNRHLGLAKKAGSYRYLEEVEKE